MRRAAVAVLALTGCLHHPAEPHGACPARAPAHGEDMGTNPDPMSALRRTEAIAIVDGNYSHHAWTSATTIGGRYATNHLTVTGQWGGALHDLEALGDSDPHSTLGNIVLGIGLRRFSTSLGGLYRRGLAIRSEIGIDVYQRSRLMSPVEDALVIARPFDQIRFAPGQHFQAMLEARYELVGCHAPFVHVEAGMRARKDTASETVELPATLTIGAHTMPDWTVYGAYDLIYANYPTIADDREILSRFRGGIELSPFDSAALDVHGAIEVGTLRSFTLAVMLSLPFGGKEKP